MLHVLFLIIKWLVVIIAVLAILTALFLRLAPTFGGKPDAATLKRIKASPNFNGETFVNLVPTNASTVDIDLSLASEVTDNNNVLWQFVFPPEGKNPSQPVATQPLDLVDSPLKDGEFVWLGHSTVLFATMGRTIITDPVFHRASPVPIGGKPFAMTHTPSTDDLPFIDAVIISHDHYDHLDHRAIQKMRGKVGHFYVPLGIKSHLLRWGVTEDKISEFDWYESITLAGSQEHGSDQGDITLTLTPTRHFSGRRLLGHRTTLWGSWAVQSPELSVYFSGDGGYSDEFAKIGARFGGFDVAFIEDGAYNERWRDVHMLPEESAQAGFDLGAKVVLPIHWGKFDLSVHHWQEPVKRIAKAVTKGNQALPEGEQMSLVTPRIGQVFRVDKIDDLPSSQWWEEAYSLTQD